VRKEKYDTLRLAFLTIRDVGSDPPPALFQTSYSLPQHPSD
jgi:hypothetical protein